MSVHQPLWWQTGVIYEIYVRSFQDSNGDGIGDLAGITRRLDYLRDTLGVDAIWITPFYPSPMADFGYDVANYVDVDPLFGDLAAFDELLAQAHARELRVIIDFVPNHTSDQHAWFQQSRQSRDNPYRDWYVWSDPKPDGSPPNNWLSLFGGSAWEWDAATGQYYLHTFLRQQPDLNWRNPAVERAMFDAIEFWLKRGVDGFRIDVAHLIMKDPDLRDNPLRPPGSLNFWRSLGEWDTQDHIHNLAHPDVHDVYRRFRALLDRYSADQPRVSIAELFRPDIHDHVSYYGKNLDEIHLPFNFRLLLANWQAGALQAVVDELEGALPPGAWPNYVLGNHDEPRIASRQCEPHARLAMMLLLTLRGTPTLYYGDEIALENADLDPAAQHDPWSRNVPGLGRDPERTPMQWSAAPNAGFTTPDAAPWLPVSPDYATRNVESQLADPISMLNLTRALLRLRRESPALHAGDYQPVQHDAVNCFVFWRTCGDERYLIALNFGDAAQTIALPAPAEIVLSTYMDRPAEPVTASLHLRPAEGCVLRPV